jgi:hypothetical protein
VSTIEERVARGAAHLDGVTSDWFAHAPIEAWLPLCSYLNTLTCQSAYTSVALGVFANEPAEIEPLFAEWIRVITERRAAA